VRKQKTEKINHKKLNRNEEEERGTKKKKKKYYLVRFKVLQFNAVESADAITEIVRFLNYCFGDHRCFVFAF
jgi:hypothetical protein